MTAAILVLVLVVMQYAQTYLGAGLAQNEFSTNQQFMATTGLQIDDVAWMMGRAQTIRYSSAYGELAVKPQILNYTMEVMYQGSSNWVLTNTFQTGIIAYNVPTKEYSLGNNYLHPISVTSNAFLQNGSTAPVAYVYSIQQTPMSDGNFARTVVVPTIRMMNTNVGSQNYTEFYLPLLVNGTSPGLSQSVTLVSQTVNQYVQSSVTQVRFNMTFPQAAGGFNSGFFPFKTTSVTVQVGSGASTSTVQLYTGVISVSIGLYS